MGRRVVVALTTLALTIVTWTTLQKSVEKEMYLMSKEEPHAAVKLFDGSWAVKRQHQVAPGDAVLAWGRYTPSSDHVSGFGELHIETSKTHGDDGDRAFAVGLLEGVLTRAEIQAAGTNLLCEVDCDGTVPRRLQKYFDDQRQWIDDQLSLKDDPLWSNVRLRLRQYDGLRSTLDDEWPLILVNWLGDLFDIQPAVERAAREDFGSGAEASKALQKHGHCSALVRIIDGDIVFGHASWFHYTAGGVRIYKHICLSFSNENFSNECLSYSSYPGMLSSLDDFYLMHDTKLAVLQTTNGIYNESLFDRVTPFGLPAWLRVQAANAIATTGTDWARIFDAENAGTYNNQYLVLDLEKTPRLTVVEQIPGLVVSADVSDQLVRDGYFPSYNVPYFPEIYDRSGYATLDAQRGRPRGSEYSLAPRAKIFRRDAIHVHSVADMQKLLRSNHYAHHDPLAPDPWSAICSRGDLVDETTSQTATLEGCYDAKVSSLSLRGSAFIISGPTHEDQPPFDWRYVTQDQAEQHKANATWSQLRATVQRPGTPVEVATGSASHIGHARRFDNRFERIDRPPAIVV